MTKTNSHKPKTSTQNKKVKDSGARLIFGDPILCAQFLRGYTDIELLKDVRPEDIEDVTGSYQILDSFGHALKCCGVVRDRRFMDVFRNIETQISELGYHPYYAVKEKIKELNGVYRTRLVKEKIKELNGVYRTRLKYFLDMHTQGFLDVSAKKRVINGEFARYEIARLVSFKKFDYVNVERFDKIKHHNLKCPITKRAQIMLMQDSKYEYWADMGEGGVFAYASITRAPKRDFGEHITDEAKK